VSCQEVPFAHLANPGGRRLKQLLQGRIMVDKFGRLLATVRLSDGRDLGGVLIQEHLAKPYPDGQQPDWC
jgi:endonuclease YncB( thermonuclease family)